MFRDPQAVEHGGASQPQVGRPQWQPEEIHGALVQLSALATVSLHLGARGSYCLRDNYSRCGTPL